ncbi:hypothetical protein LENED_001170 [Lentinula edodes]|uniref:Uncharacterized protein n=1 Tax=Lentinula edodes TaxID=5353 RepID=A0A1Q3DXP6_LENED|nr:hypothetical protein LENED_001170 [Lentinula edodes]
MAWNLSGTRTRYIPRAGHSLPTHTEELRDCDPTYSSRIYSRILPIYRKPRMTLINLLDSTYGCGPLLCLSDVISDFHYNDVFFSGFQYTHTLSRGNYV